MTEPSTSAPEVHLDPAAVEAVLDGAGMPLRRIERISTEVAASGVLTRWACSVGTGSDPADPAVDLAVYSQAARPGPASSHVTRVEADDAAVDVWIYPFDPDLPALPAVTVPDAAAVLLDRLGLEGEGARAEVIAYRPGKRAVVRLTSRSTDLFVKVLPPHRAEPLHRRHAQWHSAGLPVPRSAGWSATGLLALEPLAGRELAVHVGRAEAERVLAIVDSVRARFPAIRADSPARASLIRRVEWYRAAAAGLAPGRGQDIAALCDRIATVRDETDGAVRPAVIHGDLHLSQLLVDDDLALTGLLDIDTAGLGDPADDTAALIAHSVATAVSCSHRGDSASRDAWAELSRLAIERGASARARAIAAVHLLGHALSGSIGIDEAVDGGVELLDERPLTLVS